MLFNFVNTWHYHPDVRLVAACSSKVVKSWLFVTSAAGVSAAAGVNREWIQTGNLMLLSQIHNCPNVQKFYSEQLIIIYCLILWCLFIYSAFHVGSGILNGPVLLSTCHFPSLRLKATFHFTFSMPLSPSWRTEASQNKQEITSTVQYRNSISWHFAQTLSAEPNWYWDKYYIHTCVTGRTLIPITVAKLYSLALIFKSS